MTEEFELSENQDDVKYIVLILEQFKLKVVKFNLDEYYEHFLESLN
jgi:hypothetical protein